MKVLIILVLALQTYLATQQVEHYYTENFMKPATIWKGAARKRYLNCVKHVLTIVNRGGYDEDAYKKDINKCKITFNRTWTIHRKMV